MDYFCFDCEITLGLDEEQLCSSCQKHRENGHEPIVYMQDKDAGLCHGGGADGTNLDRLDEQVHPLVFEETLAFAEA